MLQVIKPVLALVLQVDMEKIVVVQIEKSPDWWKYVII